MKTEYDWRQETNYNGFVGCVYVIAGILACMLYGGFIYLILELIKHGL
jgi:hypothetical protein